MWLRRMAPFVAPGCVRATLRRCAMACRRSVLSIVCNLPVFVVVVVVVVVVRLFVCFRFEMLFVLLCKKVIRVVRRHRIATKPRRATVHQPIVLPTKFVFRLFCSFDIGV
jgi:hypothetical protein